MLKSRLAILLVCAAIVSVSAQSAPSPKPPFTAQNMANGMRFARTSLEIRQQIGNFSAPAEPFRIMGNLYFVGVANGESYLLTSPQGHILFGAGFETTGPLVEKNIEALGFKLADIKAILLNHWHGDQSGAVAYLKGKSGAQVMAGFGDIPYIERPGIVVAPSVTPPATPAPPAAGGAAALLSLFGPYPSPQFQGIHNYRPTTVDRALFDGDVITIGPLSVTAYLAPGHTATPTSWFFTVRDGGRDYRVLEWCCWELADDYSRNPYLSEAAVHHTFATLRKLLPIDIYLETGSYASVGDVEPAVRHLPGTVRTSEDEQQLVGESRRLQRTHCRARSVVRGKPREDASRLAAWPLGDR